VRPIGRVYSALTIPPLQRLTSSPPSAPPNGLQARRRGRDGLNMPPIPPITVAEAAQTLGVTPGRVRQLCQAHGLGEMLTPRMRLLSARDVAKLRRLIPKGR